MGRKLGKYLMSRRHTRKEAHGVELQLGRDLVTNRRVTVKVFDTHTMLAAGVGELIKFEVGTMSRTNWHPNIVQLLDVLASPKKVFVVMETVSGGDLFEAISAEGRFEDRVARHYFGQLLDAVQHCHDRGICHRNIKPENVLLDDHGNVKLTGFALAGLFDPSLGTDVTNLLHASCGTPEYAAPEVIQGSGYDGRSADVWSLGVTLYAMLAGFLPFERDSMSKVFDQVQAGEFEYAPGMSTSARSLLDGILQIEPAKRFTISQVRSHPWFTQHRAWRGIRSSMSFETKSPARAGEAGTGDVEYVFPAESGEEGSDVSTGWLGSPNSRLCSFEGPRECIEAASGSGATASALVSDEDKDMSGEGDLVRVRPLRATGSGRNGRTGPSPSNSASGASSTPDSHQGPRNRLTLSRPRRVPLGNYAFRSDDNATSCCCPRREGVDPKHRWRAPLTPPQILTPPHARQRRQQQQQRQYELNAPAEAFRPPGSPLPLMPSTPPRLRQPLSPKRQQRGRGEDSRPGGGAPCSGAAATETENDDVVLGRVDSTPGERPRLPHGSSRTQSDGLPRGPVRPHQHHWHRLHPRTRATPSPSRPSDSGGRPTAEADSAISMAAAAAAAAATGVAESAPPTRAARQLLFFVEEPDHVVLATSLREALEALGCACRVLRQCSANMHVRVKACRGLGAAEPPEGHGDDDPILGVIFALACPGAHRLGWAVAPPRRNSAREHEADAAGSREARPNGVVENADESAAVSIVTQDRGFERCNSVLVGPCSDDGTDILVTLSTGAPRDFHLLVQDLLASEGGRAIFLAGRRSPGWWSSRRMARRAGSAGPLLRGDVSCLSPARGQACYQ